MHVLVGSLAVAGFTTLWRAGHLPKRNEADSGSLALRLTRSLAGASTAGLLPTPPGPLPAQRAIRKAISFQVTRSVRLILTLQRRRDAGQTMKQVPPRLSLRPPVSARACSGQGPRPWRRLRSRTAAPGPQSSVVCSPFSVLLSVRISSSREDS